MIRGAQGTRKQREALETALQNEMGPLKPYILFFISLVLKTTNKYQNHMIRGLMVDGTIKTPFEKVSPKILKTT